MANEVNRSEEASYAPSPAQLELLEVLLEPDDAPYPWNNADPESENYFVAAEQEFVEDWLEQEITARAPTFFSQVDQLWSTTIPVADSAAVKSVSTLQSTLRSEFAARIPQGWLDRIANIAQQISTSEQPMAAQLVQCVQILLPNWAEEDLLVLARPFAYAMRGNQMSDIEFVLGELRLEDWTALSEIEQARMSLAIARYALDQVADSRRNERGTRGQGDKETRGKD
jgi:hypothetical protein